MNKKGFAISIVLYSLVFLLISILYMILGVLKTRYHVENDLRNAVVQELNESIIMTAAEAISRVQTLEEIGDAKRYVGTNPNNYVLFNGERWRIIGVYGERLKIIRAMPLIESFKYSDAGSREWSESLINTFLNGSYYDGLSENARNMVDEVSWDIGSTITSYSYNANQAYAAAQESKWTGKIGLISDYEYMYAAGIDCATTSGANFEGNCTNNNWLLRTINDNTDYAWTIHNSLVVSTIGNISTSVDVISNYLVNPVIYLKPEVKIARGKGTITNEFTLGISAPKQTEG